MNRIHLALGLALALPAFAAPARKQWRRPPRRTACWSMARA